MLFLLAILFFIVDRILKYFYPIYYNYDGPFSLAIPNIFLNILGVVLLVIFIFLFFKAKQKKDFFSSVIFLFIILGGASNLFDRIYFGYVIDYINFFGLGYFNISDGMLAFGIIILLFLNFKGGKDKNI